MSNSYNEMITSFLTPQPKDVEGLNNSSYFYYRNQLYTKIFSIFDFKGIPENWNMNYFLDNLFMLGFIGISKTDAGVIPLRCSYNGINLYNFPTKLIFANPVLGTFDRTIGEDAEIVYLNYINRMFLGCEEFVKRYAMLLAQCDGSINATLMNSRVAHVFQAETTAELRSLQKMYDEASKGNPAIFLKKQKSIGPESDIPFFVNVKNTYIGREILETKRSIMNEFLTEIGINNANTDKRERLNEEEVNANNSEISSIVSVWLWNLKECFKRVNKIFGLNISVDFSDVIKNNFYRKEDEQLDMGKSDGFVE